MSRMKSRSSLGSQVVMEVILRHESAPLRFIGAWQRVGALPLW